MTICALMYVPRSGRQHPSAALIGRAARALIGIVVVAAVLLPGWVVRTYGPSADGSVVAADGAPSGAGDSLGVGSL